MPEVSNLEEVLSEHFNLHTVEVKQDVQHSIDALGIELTDAQIATLAGAPSGSKVVTSVIGPYRDVSKKNDANKEEDVPGGLLLTVTNPDYIGTQNEVIVYTMIVTNAQQQDEISFGIYIKLVDFDRSLNKKTFAGMGAYFTAVIVRAAKSFDGCKEIRLQAAGGRSWNDRLPPPVGGRWYGYITWPKYGFDMDLTELTQSIIPYFKYDPEGLSTCRTVSDVLGLKGGYDFWKVAGDGWDMVFDLTTNSSVEILNKFLKGRI